MGLSARLGLSVCLGLSARLSLSVCLSACQIGSAVLPICLGLSLRLRPALR